MNKTFVILSSILTFSIILFTIALYSLNTKDVIGQIQGQKEIIVSHLNTGSKPFSSHFIYGKVMGTKLNTDAGRFINCDGCYPALVSLDINGTEVVVDVGRYEICQNGESGRCSLDYTDLKVGDVLSYENVTSMHPCKTNVSYPNGFSAWYDDNSFNATNIPNPNNYKITFSKIPCATTYSSSLDWFFKQ